MAAQAHWRQIGRAAADSRRRPASAAAPMGTASPGPARSADSAKPGAVEIYYDTGRKTFWTQNTRGEWIDLTEGALKRVLKSTGLLSVPVEGAHLSALDARIMELQLSHDVHFAGELAGYPAGLHEVCGSRVLVTRGAHPVRPAKGSCETVKAFFGELVGEQLPYLLGWLRSAMVALRGGPSFRPGQMLALAGPAGCGKSLCQSLITELLGGRVAKPYRYLTSETAFNSDLFESEHLAIEDEAASTDLRTRRQFGANLKNLIVNEVQSYHAKGRPALSLTPFWRVSITLNDEAENLMVLPPLDDSLRDKITLLQATRVNFPFSPDHVAERKAYRAQLSKELPAFLAWLREWRIPDRLKDQRYGIKAWQNPDLVQSLEELSPEFGLLELIDEFFGQHPALIPWEGTASELQRQLEDYFKEAQTKRVFTWLGAAGKYLQRLNRRWPERFQPCGVRRGIQRFRITRPE